MPRQLRIAPAILFLVLPFVAHADEGDTLVMKHDPERYRIVVTASKTPRPLRDVPGSTAVLSGAELRRRGARTLADALQDVVGLDAADGSDNGSRQPNIGLWGLKEFDALLVTVDGVPVGGPFNPSLVQIPVDDIDRIEILKGPQGSLYGVSAFAGAVNVFTRGTKGRDEVTVGGGMFDQLNARASMTRDLGPTCIARFTAMSLRDGGWQDRTSGSLDRAGVSLDHTAGATRLQLDVHAFRDNQHWGTALPWDAGAPLPGFQQDANVAVSGARIEHRVLAASARSTTSLRSGMRLENTLGFARDNQTYLRSFPTEFDPNGDTFASEGVFLEPKETSVFDDARLVTPLHLGGEHELVTGAAITWGRTDASGIGFDFDQNLSTYPMIPGVAAIPVGDHRSFEDSRTFLGLYAHDAWTPVARLTVSAGGRFDRTSETLDTKFQETGAPVETGSDDRSDQAWSGDLGAVARVAPATWGERGYVNLFGNWKSSFKPAAPNLTEAEEAEILDPERTHSVEGGVRIGALDEQLELEASYFKMDFENMVVSNLGPGGGPELLNAGHERFKGYEVTLHASPDAMHGFRASVGFAHHDARFVDFTFVTPDSQLRDVGGKKLELVPEELLDVSASYRAPCGASVWASVREQGERPLTRRNTFFTEAYTEWDAGASYEVGDVMLQLVGRNLGDDRHPVSESDLGDSQFYTSAPRRVTGTVTIRY